MDLFDLTNRKALVTGASRGIGQAIAAGLAERGAALAITGRKPDILEAVAAQLGAQVLAISCNQGNPADIDHLFAQLDEKDFSPDIAVINAATNPIMAPLLDTDPAAWQKIMDVNLTGAWLTARQAARRMLAHPGPSKGAIVIVTSVAAFDPIPGLGAYSVSKAGLIGLTKALAKELAPGGVRVNAIAPGLIETRFSTALFQDQQGYERWMAQVPMGRHGQPGDIVGAAVYLASEASAYVTGQVLIVDGGGRM